MNGGFWRCTCLTRACTVDWSASHALVFELVFRIKFPVSAQRQLNIGSSTDNDASMLEIPPRIKIISEETRMEARPFGHFKSIEVGSGCCLATNKGQALI
jgi:hypothetical protein